MNKKKYVKPQVLIASFELSESIATGCEQISNSAAYVCAVEDKEAEMTYVSDGISACVFTPPNVNDYVCYHGPADSYNVFTS